MAEKRISNNKLGVAEGEGNITGNSAYDYYSDPTHPCYVPRPKNEFEETVGLMMSEDYKERFKAEYLQTKIRYERLKAFNTKIEAAERMEFARTPVTVDMPKHDCPSDLLKCQQSIMGEYLHILEVRAVIEGIEL